MAPEPAPDGKRPSRLAKHRQTRRHFTFLGQHEPVERSGQELSGPVLSLNVFMNDQGNVSNDFATFDVDDSDDDDAGDDGEPGEDGDDDDGSFGVDDGMGDGGFQDDQDGFDPFTSLVDNPLRTLQIAAPTNTMTLHLSNGTTTSTQFAPSMTITLLPLTSANSARSSVTPTTSNDTNTHPLVASDNNPPPMLHIKSHYNPTLLLIALLVGTVCVSVTLTIVIIRYVRKQKRARLRKDLLQKQLGIEDVNTFPHDGDEKASYQLHNITSLLSHDDQTDIVITVPDDSAGEMKPKDPMQDPNIQDTLKRRMAGISTASLHFTHHPSINRRSSRWNAVESWIRKKVRLEAEKKLDGTSELSPSPSSSTRCKPQRGQPEDEESRFKHPLGGWGVKSWGPESQYWKKKGEGKSITLGHEVQFDSDFPEVSRFSDASDSTQERVLSHAFSSAEGEIHVPITNPDPVGPQPNQQETITKNETSSLSK